MNEYLKKISVIILTVFLFSYPVMAMADGMMMPPSEYWINETGQKAVIMYEDGIETMVVSTSFTGNADDFAWVIPVPSKPEVSKGSDELFASLKNATQTNVYYEKSFFGMDDAVMNSAGNSVTVVESKNVDYYEVTILTATDTDDLATWFTKNGYNFPITADYILESYIENGWYFVAMKINPDSLDFSDVESELREGHATPVLMSFATEHPVYPMKISSIISQNKIESDVATYATGKFGKAIKVNTADIISSYNDVLSADIKDKFNTAGGSLSMWVKPNYTYSYASNLQAMTIYNDENAPIFSLSVEYSDISGSYMLLRVADKNGYTTDWITENINYQNNVWQRIGVTWEEGQMPKIYFQGNEMAIVDVNNISDKDFTLSNAVFEMIDLKGNEEMHIGESGNYAYVDEFKIFDIPQDDTVMLSEYLATEPVVNAEDSGLIISGHFDDSLTEEIGGGSFNYTAGSTTLNDYYENIPVLLYVLAEGRIELPGFNTNYANVIDKTSMERLAVNETGAPMLQPNNNKLFLTVLSDSLPFSEMNEDLFLRNSTLTTTIGKEIKIEKQITSQSFNIALGISFLLSIIFGVGILIINRKPIQ